MESENLWCFIFYPMHKLSTIKTITYHVLKIKLDFIICSYMNKVEFLKPMIHKIKNSEINKCTLFNKYLYIQFMWSWCSFQNKSDDYNFNYIQWVLFVDVNKSGLWGMVMHAFRIGGNII